MLYHPCDTSEIKMAHSWTNLEGCLTKECYSFFLAWMLDKQPMFISHVLSENKEAQWRIILKISLTKKFSFKVELPIHVNFS